MLLRTFMAPRNESLEEHELMDAKDRETFLFVQNQVLNLEVHE